MFVGKIDRYWKNAIISGTVLNKQWFVMVGRYGWKTHFFVKFQRACDDHDAYTKHAIFASGH